MTTVAAPTGRQPLRGRHYSIAALSCCGAGCGRGCCNEAHGAMVNRVSERATRRNVHDRNDSTPEDRPACADVCGTRISGCRRTQFTSTPSGPDPRCGGAPWRRCGRRQAAQRAVPAWHPRRSSRCAPRWMPSGSAAYPPASDPRAPHCRLRTRVYAFTTVQIVVCKQDVQPANSTS